jgi:hypothetical protein
VRRLHVPRLFWPTVLGFAAAALVVLAFAILGSAFGRPYGPPWVCDDTRFVDTVPVGRAVVGPAVSPVPGCGA